MSLDALPGMVVGAAGGPGDEHPHVVRTAPNLWWICAGDPSSLTSRFDELADSSMPSQLFPPAPSNGHTTVVAKLELDVCGAWLTLANAGPSRPVVVRRAGWVDVRGHPVASADDRVGLGPGDVLVLRCTGVEEDDVLDAALRAAGAHPAEVARVVAAATDGNDSVVALGVPHELGADPRERVESATGVAVAEGQSPGYPLADIQPDLWKEPPRPPRLARLRLTPELQTVSAVRSLLDRLLASWRLGGRIDDDDVKLVATELAANAVVHSDQPQSVTIRYLGDVLRVEVVDMSIDLPRPTVPDENGVGGRGLHLVEALGSAWGTEPLDQGKRVWCELAVASA